MCAALMADAAVGQHAHAMQLASGSYTGNGAATRPVTDVGFRPDAVIVKGNTAEYAVLRTSTMTGDAAKELAAGAVLQSKRIQSLDAGGFTVGNHAEVNRSGVAYSWVAFKDNGAGDFRIGAYVGSGADNRSIIGLGFQPAYVIVMSAGGQRAVHRSSAMAGDSSVQFDSTGPKPNYIQALQPDGFQVGKDARVNAAGTAYHYVAWKAVAGSMSAGSYAGNGADNRAIIGAGFRPDYVIVKAGASEAGVHRTAIPSGDRALMFSASANVTNAIQGLDDDGFQVGSASSVNKSRTTYFWVAFRAPAAVVRATALAITSINGGTHPAAGTGFSVVVQSRDDAGGDRSVTTATGILLSVKTGSGALAGTLTGTIPAGASQVVLGGVTYTRAESGVVLTATRTGGDTVAPGDSAPFTVDPGAIASYAISLASPQPAGATFEVTATARDQFANRVTTDSSTLVTFSSASGHLLFDGNADGTSGDASTVLSAGILTMNARGTLAETTTIAATDANGRTGSASLTIIGGAPSVLAFITQPGDALADAPISGPPTVTVQDDYGNTPSSSNTSISVGIGANPGGGVLSGTTLKAAAAGVAAFLDLTINEPGSGYTLIASSTGLAPAVSSTFTIAPATGAMSGRITRASDGSALAGATVDALQAGTVKASTTSDADGNYTMAGLSPGAYDARASAAGYQSQTRTGVTVIAGTVAPVHLSLSQLPGPTIRITAPAAGSALADPVVLVQGEVQAPAGSPVGISVNGIPGVVEDGRFAALVPVDPSVVSLTAALNGLSNTLATHTITVTVTVAAPMEEPQVQLQTNPPGGPAPLAVTFHLSSLVGVREIALDADDDGIIDFQGPTLDGVSMTYQRPGVYVAKAQVTDSQGQAHTALTFVHVLDAAALDAQLQAVWASFKDAVRARDLARASGFLHGSTRAAYQAQLAALSQASLADIDQIMTQIQLVKIGLGGAQYEMLRQDAGQFLSFAVWFQIDEDGVWRLRRF